MLLAYSEVVLGNFTYPLDYGEAQRHMSISFLMQSTFGILRVDGRGRDIKPLFGLFLGEEPRLPPISEAQASLTLRFWSVARGAGKPSRKVLG